ncbi:hypothetical protein IFM89_034185 [Coptis chinensis]|uniref:DUF4408 domain-containing protein n=1 Tax=Coptis chinensis TaxID=261450 RepID=A0A835LFC1_9MAGN|nr:hypothetical protein IFM89_034185 [Coptis chinensis]
MLEESIPAVWASMNSWFTPTLLFVFLNLMIGTIAITSGGFGTQKQNRENNNNNNQQPSYALTRATRRTLVSRLLDAGVLTLSEVVQVTRPATVREGKSTLQSFGDDEEVDAKADDFINKFKNQLKLQRLDSILRYKEMLGRGADK